MIRLRRPSEEEIGACLGSSDVPFSYSEVGATADFASLESLEVSYDVDRNQFSLGTGRDLFERARSSLMSWRHFDIPWLELYGAKEQVSSGHVVATLTRAAAIWYLNPCRVVYTEGTSDSASDAAFAYGTLPGHVERGEERFRVHFNPITDQVTYEVVAFSRPAILLSKIGHRWVRRIQKRFVASTAEALARACRPTRRCS